MSQEQVTMAGLLGRATAKKKASFGSGSFNYLGVGFIVLILAAWELAVRTGVIQAFGLPPFSSVAENFFRSAVNGELAEAMLPSLARWAAGYTIAIVIGIVVGMLMGYFNVFHRLLEPITELIRPIPSPAYLPIAILFLGIDNAMKIFVIAFASFFPILLNTASGVRSIDSVQLNTARTFGVPNAMTIAHVVIPAAAPYIFTGMRISLAVSLILTIIAEMVAGDSGIGYYILVSQRTFEIDRMYAGVIALGLLGYVLNRLFLIVESRLLKWHRAGAGSS